MAAGVSVGIHGWQVVWWCGRRGGSCAQSIGVGSFALWCPQKGAGRAQLLRAMSQQLAASSTALWQPGLVPCRNKTWNRKN